MSKKRVFTKEELKEMGARDVDAAMKAVEADDKEKAKKFIRRMNDDFQLLHDSFINWIAELMDYIYTHDGEEALYQAMRRAVGVYMRSGGEGEPDLRQQVQLFASGLRAHLVGLDIEEDDEKVTLKMQPCGSGQRLLESGAYEAPRNLSRVKAHRMTWGLPNFPIYCVHMPLQEILTIEGLKHLVCFCLPAEDVATESCRFVFYKDHKSIPEEIYERIGMKKPKRDEEWPIETQ